MKKLILFLFSVLLGSAGTAFAEANSPEISYFSSGSELTVEISNVNREDVQAILWDGTDVSSFLEELAVAGELSVTDTENGFTIVLNQAPDLDGKFGLQLANGTKVTVPLQHSADEVESGLRRAPTLQVYGNVKYRKPNCLFYRCWQPAKGATITVKPLGLSGASSKTTTVDSKGNYNTGKINWCGQFNITVEYNGFSKTYSKQPPMALCLWNSTVRARVNFEMK